jgi:hypothetical protein
MSEVENKEVSKEESPATEATQETASQKVELSKLEEQIIRQLEYYFGKFFLRFLVEKQRVYWVFWFQAMPIYVATNSYWNRSRKMRDG